MANQGYIRKNLSWHLRGACLILELGSILLSLQWMNAQIHTGGLLGLNNDLQMLPEVIEESDIPSRSPVIFSPSVHASVKLILKVLEACSSNLRKGHRVLSFILLSRLFALSQTNSWIYHFL